MNRDQIRGGFKDTAGKIQRKFGQLFGSHQQEADGTVKQAEGKTQSTAGDVKEAIDKATDKAKDTLKK